MSTYFGTDGIRGIVNENLTTQVAFKCGNALCSIKKRPIVLVGQDTRRSGDMIKLGLAGGITAGGGDVIDLGILPTAAVSYLTTFYKADFGVVISASHNPKEFNGIKIFGSDGYKLSEDEEKRIEAHFNVPHLAKPERTGVFKSDLTGKKFYENYLINSAPVKLDGLKLVLDCANGAASLIAPDVFRHLGAQVIAINDDTLNNKINENCGALHISTLKKAVRANNASAGFAYDGDADRLICCDENTNLVDGDKLLYIFAKNCKDKKKLVNDCVVGTSHTNMGIEKALNKQDINLLRSDIGDKYVMQLMKKSGAIIGAEQSGHIIFSDLSMTGDGILASLQLAVLLHSQKLSELADVFLYPQTNINVRVSDKIRILGNERLAEELEKQRQILSGKGRIIVRASGTEPIIRIFSETENAQLSSASAKYIERVIEELENN